MTGRKNIAKRIIKTGILLLVAGSLFFLYRIPYRLVKERALLLSYGNHCEEERQGTLGRAITEHVLLYRYAGCEDVKTVSVQSPLSVEEIMLAEARDEETIFQQESVEENIKEQQLLKEEMEKENIAVRQEELQSVRGEEEEKQQEKQQEEGAQEVMTPVSKEISLEPYRDFDLLIRDFYVVDKSTYITEEELNVEKMLNYDLRISNLEGEGETEEPKVLIYHTHSQEGYADSVPGDSSTTVVGAGERLAQLLQEEYGIPVLHHTGEYDVTSRDYAYANVEPWLKKILEENPSIEVVIDLHRDGVAADTHLLTEINGKKTAQFMFFNGLSRLKSTGDIEYLKNENREGNLAFSFQLQMKCMQYYPGLARSIYLKGYRYNMQYREKSLLVELGAQTNTVEEVWNALPPLAHVISMVLLGE